MDHTWFWPLTSPTKYCRLWLFWSVSEWRWCVTWITHMPPYYRSQRSLHLLPLPIRASPRRHLTLAVVCQKLPLLPGHVPTSTSAAAPHCSVPFFLSECREWKEEEQWGASRGGCLHQPTTWGSSLSQTGSPHVGFSVHVIIWAAFWKEFYYETPMVFYMLGGGKATLSLVALVVLSWCLLNKKKLFLFDKCLA